ncbi:hypothetical protein GCM10010329_79220 [Streptomyces spiroverticillatus]|uniref:Uncharacterized protein n=1 Tax=Streptomyces finlayi TaxID=67296 RepID=A0A918X8D6_9ACTN|nr:hypothetical protein [Streptomyces finlayi]GHA44695.1 hypothetical protein GCM10010329_79220 [Streptomyces spiroverticillatus]GHD17929.1 hypothetical protein GCM10010334_80200 [Streptomyces finlayi]
MATYEIAHIRTWRPPMPEAVRAAEPRPGWPGRHASDEAGLRTQEAAGRKAPLPGGLTVPDADGNVVAYDGVPYRSFVNRRDRSACSTPVGPLVDAVNRWFGHQLSLSLKG